MNRNEVVKIFTQKITLKDFHWLSYHFDLYAKGHEHFLAASIVDCCLNVENKLPGFTDKFSDKLASLSNNFKHLPHYEQIIQLLSELLVTNYLCTRFSENAVFILEPTLGKHSKNPELGIKDDGKELYIEVKCREFIAHHNNRASAAIELPTRMDNVREIAADIVQAEETIVLPRDNVVKDFLKSANEKFEVFKQSNPNSITVLIIVWDDFTYEPVSSLLNEATGLLTEKSFYKEGDLPVKFDYINSIVLVKHSHHLVRATRDQVPLDNLTHPLDWGEKKDVLPKAYIPVNSSPEIDEYLCDLFQASHIESLKYFADFRPQEIVFRF